MQVFLVRLVAVTVKLKYDYDKELRSYLKRKKMTDINF